MNTGRYAPSPTGRLHLGSLLAALASFCQARAQGGAWRLRIDDLDTPRVVAGAASDMIETLAAFGLIHDGPIMYQSERRSSYIQAIERLLKQADAFECGCTRREAQGGPVGLDGPIYPGTCRSGLPSGRCARSVRARVGSAKVSIVDGIQGRYEQNLEHDIGDFVIQRADGIAAYQLATVIDDAAQGVDMVVRGSDLLSSTPRQRWLQNRLGLPETVYCHIPVVVDDEGTKLGKSNGALALDSAKKSVHLVECLALLGQCPPHWLTTCSVRRIIDWALDNWHLSAVPRQRICHRSSMYTKPA